ncbi:MAG: aconitase X catalytic domain-containing protein [Methanophagales archaeon]|nr:aconitase X catalytic domain-containing protein [Methanophagales archaeon]MCW3140770.1 aconitase X catalytic domain-containing protein [Methanophagales archaeon]
MHLTKEEERILEGEEGWTKKKAMEILVAIGDINHASELIPIKSAHVSGVSYKTIGEAFEFVNSLEGTVKVESTLNPIGMDIEKWDEMGISIDFAIKQEKVLAAYKKLGISAECTCVPYLIGNAPDKGEHLAWAESSAVLYANSVLGARTNMEGAPSALAAALIGKTPSYGLHQPENREPEIRVCVKCNLADADYSALGFLIGNLVGDKIPLIELFSSSSVSSPSKDELKHLSAAIGATGSVGMYHIKGITPEAGVEAGAEETESKLSEEKIEIEKNDIEEFYIENNEPDVIAVGCPHCSSCELTRIYELLKAEGKRRKVRRDFFIFTARAIEQSVQTQRIVEKIENFGVKVICDTCFVVSPAFENYDCVLTNSGKMLRYVPLLCGGANARLCNTKECVKEAF